MTPEQKIAFMREQKDKVLGYLQDQLEIANNALKFYEDTPIQDNTDIEIQKIREIERIKLVQSQQDLIKHISVIKKM